MEKLYRGTEDILKTATNVFYFFNADMRYVTGTIPTEMIVELFDNEEIKQYQFCSVIHPLLYSDEDAVSIGSQYSLFSYYCFFNDKQYALGIEMLDQEPECEGDNGFYTYTDDDYVIILHEHSFSKKEIDTYTQICNIWFRCYLQEHGFKNIVYLSKDGWKCCIQSREHIENDKYEVNLKLHNKTEDCVVSVFFDKKDNTSSSKNLDETFAKDENLAVMFYVVETLFNE